MKIICNKNELLDGINIVLKAVSSKTTMPILECIVIDAGETVHLISNNMELGIDTAIEAHIVETGSIALNAKFLSDIIRKLPDDIITIETDYDYKATIVSGKSKFNISGKSTQEFPELPVFEKKNPIKISQYTLREIIRQTSFSIGYDENNQIMTGELFEIKENNLLRIVSLDGHRISLRKVFLKDSYEDVKVIVPGKTLIELSKIISDDSEKDVSIYFTDKQALFEFDDTIVTSRLIEGEYFRIDQMLTNDYETKITINKSEFSDCIDRASLLIKETEKKPLVVNISGNDIELKVNSSIGSMNEDIAVEKEGADMVIGFNPKFLLDSLKVIDDEYIDLYLINPKAPCYIKDKNDTYIYLILPVNITDNI